MQIHQTSLIEDQKACHQKWFPWGQGKGFAGRNDLLCMEKKMLSVRYNLSHLSQITRCMLAKHRLGIQSKQSLHLHRFSGSQVCMPQSFEMDHLTILGPQVLNSVRFNETGGAKRTSWKQVAKCQNVIENSHSYPCILQSRWGQFAQAKCLTQFENFTTVPILTRTFNT